MNESHHRQMDDLATRLRRGQLSRRERRTAAPPCWQRGPWLVCPARCAPKRGRLGGRLR